MQACTSELNVTVTTEYNFGGILNNNAAKFISYFALIITWMQSKYIPSLYIKYFRQNNDMQAFEAPFDSLCHELYLLMSSWGVLCRCEMALINDMSRPV